MFCFGIILSIECRIPIRWFVRIERIFRGIKGVQAWFRPLETAKNTLNSLVKNGPKERSRSKTSGSRNDIYRLRAATSCHQSNTQQSHRSRRDTPGRFLQTIRAGFQAFGSIQFNVHFNMCFSSIMTSSHSSHLHSRWIQLVEVSLPK